jgi:hypothetical protein
LRLVEVLSEVHLITGLGGVLFNPGVRSVRQDFTPDEGFYATFLFGVPEPGAGLVFDDRRFAVQLDLIETVHRFNINLARLMDFATDRSF